MVDRDLGRKAFRGSPDDFEKAYLGKHDTQALAPCLSARLQPHRHARFVFVVSQIVFLIRNYAQIFNSIAGPRVSVNDFALETRVPAIRRHHLGCDEQGSTSQMLHLGNQVRGSVSLEKFAAPLLYCRQKFESRNPPNLRRDRGGSGDFWTDQ